MENEKRGSELGKGGKPEIRAEAVELVVNELKKTPRQVRFLKQMLANAGFAAEAENEGYVLGKFPCKVDRDGWVRLKDEDDIADDLAIQQLIRPAKIVPVPIPREKKNQWDKVVVNKGVYQVDGLQAQQYLFEVLGHLLFGDTDYRCFIVMGESRDQDKFLRHAVAERLTDDKLTGQPEFIFLPQRKGPDDDVYARSLESEDDVEYICNLMRNAVSRGYHKVGGDCCSSPV
jgi:hypothetical protein